MKKVPVSLKNEIRKPTQNEKEQHSIILAVFGVWPNEKIVRSNLARLDFRPNLQVRCLDRTFFSAMNGNRTNHAVGLRGVRIAVRAEICLEEGSV